MTESVSKTKNELGKRGMSDAKLKVKGIMFDLDGTILDTKLAYLEAARIACKAIGLNELENELALEVPKRMEQRRPLNNIIGTNTKEFVQAYLKAFYRVSASKTLPMPFVADTLDVLNSKAKLAVITMRFMPRKMIVKELNQFCLDKYFIHVITGLDTRLPKPSPEALIKAAAAMNVHMFECAIVGDSIVDVKAGKAAGAKTIAVLSGLYSREELEKADPDYIINSIAELPRIVA